MARTRVSSKDIRNHIYVKTPEDIYGEYAVKNLKGNLALPSYVHGYSLAIEYMYNWFKSKFPDNFFRGGIYIDGKNVLDDYRRLNDFAMRNIVKGENPRARMAPTIEYDFDREGLDLYLAPPEVYLMRSKYQDSFFKDYDRNLFLGMMPRALRMNVAYKVRLNSRSQQLDTFNRMELYFRNGSTQYEYISVDFHVPKYIILNIAKIAGFKIVNGEVEDTMSFLHYLNLHSEVTFLFKLRAINQQPEYFIRLNDVYAHIAVRDKLQLDDGERDGKLDFNFGIEMNATLTLPIPHYYSLYEPAQIMKSTLIQEVDREDEGCVAIYSINLIDIPKVDEHGWNQGAITDYLTDEGDTEIDMTPIFTGSNPLARAIEHEMTRGISPARFINIKIYRDEDLARKIDFTMDWENKKLKFVEPMKEEVLHIAIYYDRIYIDEIDSELFNYKKSRITTDNKIVKDKHS